jgi:hypothetical protein
MKDEKNLAENVKFPDDFWTKRKEEDEVVNEVGPRVTAADKSGDKSKKASTILVPLLRFNPIFSRSHHQSCFAASFVPCG